MQGQPSACSPLSRLQPGGVCKMPNWPITTPQCFSSSPVPADEIRRSESDLRPPPRPDPVPPPSPPSNGTLHGRLLPAQKLCTHCSLCLAGPSPLVTAFCWTFPVAFDRKLNQTSLARKESNGRKFKGCVASGPARFRLVLLSAPSTASSPFCLQPHRPPAATWGRQLQA